MKEVIPEDALIFTDVGWNKNGVAQEFDITIPGTIHHSSGLATMGFGAAAVMGGKGHSCGIYSWDDDHINRLGMCAPVSRIMVRQPNNRGNSGSSTNGMPPTSSMGCGTWGGNIVSENITLKHYMNTTWVARPLPYDMPSNEELFGEFNKPDIDQE